MASPRSAQHAGPPDGGWGWMIVAGCFLVTICTRAVTRCISIFFVEFQTYFGQDYARTAWIHSIVDCATMLCAPLGSLISNHVSCQVGIMLGGLLASTGLILSSFATSLEHLYLSLGVLTGLGFALCYSPAIAMVGKYFNKRKALAYGIAMSGSGIVPYALSAGVSHHQAAFLMSILGVIDIIGNITFGWLTDRRCLKKHRHFCYLFAVGMDGLCCLFLPVLQNFPLLVPFSFTFGYFDGAYVTLIPVITADVVGTSSLSSALGVVYFLHAIPYLVSPPVAGWLVDTTGSYTASFLLCGFSMIFSSTLLCFANLAKKIKRTHLLSLTNDTGTKQHIWTNGAIAYSVTAELDQKDVEFLAADINSYSNR
ncbi:monocarboxylate transporter 12 isoform X3 [Lathamus discolor]|uniref:monocarboxylate transporter 12 isoform X3 n=1 Tax=Lathamus discolor TaxID=678569 RepID=UPI0032B70BD5